MNLSNSDLVWNRAATEAGGPNPARGDIALSSLLLLHGAAMNGGMDDALTSLSTEQFAAGIEGFRFFGLVEVSNFLREVEVAGIEGLEGIEERYGSMVPSDDTLTRAFEKKFASSPELFSGS